ncbi:MAG: hypothetical protein K0U74_12500 [Alphaproteobacteria bacterium]|nr:hypothetical protein [Alphaproteobacteria bacterium]
MIGHVAAAGEERGRVVLRLTGGARVSDIALEAAARIARAYDSEIESLFVEDRQLADLTGHAFAREISHSGRCSRELSGDDIEREFRAVFRTMQARVEAVAKRFEARSFSTRVRDDPIDALARACSSAGPWNVVVLGEAFKPQDARALGAILSKVRDATGLVTVGPNSRSLRGPVVVAIEDPEHLVAMIRTAERLAGNSGMERGAIVVMLVGNDFEHLHWLEGQARLLFAHGPQPRIVAAPPARGESASVAEAIRRQRAGFVIAQYGGLAVPADDLKALAAALESPLFLVR